MSKTFNGRLVDAQQAYAYMLRQAAYIEPGVYEAVYPEIIYPTLVPVDTSAPEWTRVVTYYSGNKAGAAQWINAGADDMPRATSTKDRFDTSVHTAGIGYGYDLEEISYAALLGINLANDEAMAARRAYEEFVERVAIAGDADKGYTGLINNPGVTAATAQFGDWNDPATTPDQILSDFNAGILGQWQSVNFSSMADTVLLPYVSWVALATRRMGTDGNSETILQFLQRSNLYTVQTGRPLMIRGIRGLDTLGAGGTRRAVFYRRDPSVVKLHIPMPHKFLPVWQAGPTRWEVPGIFRLGGTDIRRTGDFLYLDGV